MFSITDAKMAHLHNLRWGCVSGMYNFDKLLMLKLWSGNSIEILSSQVVLQYDGVLTFGYYDNLHFFHKK